MTDLQAQITARIARADQALAHVLAADRAPEPQFTIHTRYGTEQECPHDPSIEGPQEAKKCL